MTAWLSAAETAEILGVTVESLRQMRYLRKGPRFYKPTSKTVLYDPAEVEEYIRSTAVATA